MLKKLLISNLDLRSSVIAIPNIKISTNDLADAKSSIKSSINSTRCQQNSYSPCHQVSSQTPNNLKTKLSSPASQRESSLLKRKEEETNIHPSKNSAFSFRMQYFKPLEEAMLDTFIQNVSECRRSSVDRDLNETANKTPQIMESSTVATAESPAMEMPKLNDTSSR